MKIPKIAFLFALLLFGLCSVKSFSEDCVKDNISSSWKDNRKKSTWTISDDGKITCKGNCTYIARVNTSKYGSQPSYEFINFGRPAAWEKNSNKISLIWSEGYIKDFECIIDAGNSLKLEGETFSFDLKKAD